MAGPGARPLGSPPWNPPRPSPEPELAAELSQLGEDLLLLSVRPRRGNDQHRHADQLRPDGLRAHPAGRAAPGRRRPAPDHRAERQSRPATPSWTRRWPAWPAGGHSGPKTWVAHPRRGIREAYLERLAAGGRAARRAAAGSWAGCAGRSPPPSGSSGCGPSSTPSPSPPGRSAWLRRRSAGWPTRSAWTGTCTRGSPTGACAGGWPRSARARPGRSPRRWTRPTRRPGRRARRRRRRPPRPPPEAATQAATDAAIQAAVQASTAAAISAAASAASDAGGHAGGHAGHH